MSYRTNHRLGILASGSGTDYQSVYDHWFLGVLQNAVPVVLISNKKDAKCLERAKKGGLFYHHVPYKSSPDPEAEKTVISLFEKYDADLILCLGWLKIDGSQITEKYRWRKMNAHPAHSHIYGGKGMYGEKVHEAVLKAGDKETFPTVHYMDEGIDTGPIIINTLVKVKPDDTPHILSERVKFYEHRLISKAVQLHVDGKLRVEKEDVKFVVRHLEDEIWEREWLRRQERYFEYQKSPTYIKDCLNVGDMTLEQLL